MPELTSTPIIASAVHRPVARLFCAVLCGYLALGATLQVLPAFVPARFHGGPVLVGVTVGIAFLATALCRPIAGRIADAGRARPVVLVGGVCTALGGIGQFTAGQLGSAGIALLLVARLVMGAGEAALFSGAQPWVLAGIPAAKRGRIAGWFGLSMWCGLAGGPVLAVALTGWFGAASVWWSVVGGCLLSALLVLATPAQQSTKDVRLRLAHWRELVPVGASLPGFGLGLASFGYGTINALLVLFLRTDRLGGDSVALAVFALGFLAARTFGSPLVDRLGGARIACVVLLVEATGLGIIACASSGLVALIGTVVVGLGLGPIYPATVSMTLHRAGGNQVGVSVGVMTSFWDLGVLAAGPIGGVLAAGPGFRVAFGIAVVLVLGAFATALTLAGIRWPTASSGGRRDR
ncbi:MAG TPA: MFS transporter [Pseudonocardiaceae bacterium]|jgi:MFS family permease|nr:MFS transporter [Pseudonocardiaceae bacterium]